MKLEERPGGFALYKEKTEVGCCQLTRTAAEGRRTLFV